MSGAGRAPGMTPVGPGSPGKDGRVELAFAPDGAGGTCWTRRRARAPLAMMRPLYVDPAAPGTPVAYLMALGGGLVQGDRATVEVAVAAGGHAVITTQAATRVHRMDAGHAEAATRLRVGPGAVLEHLADPVLAVPGARLVQGTRAEVAAGGALILVDSLVLTESGGGRDRVPEPPPARVRARLDVDCAGTPLLRERLRLGGPAGPVGLGEAGAVGGLTCVGDPPAVAAAVAAMRAVAVPGARIGVSTLAGGRGAWARVAGVDPARPAEPVGLALRALWAAARPALLGLPAFDLRKR